MKFFLLFIFLISIQSHAENKKNYEVVAVNHYLHGSLWKNSTVASFWSHLGAADPEVSITVLPWKGPDKDSAKLAGKIRNLKPDLVFLSEPLITKHLAGKIYSKENPVKIVFIGLGSPSSISGIPENDQAGIFPQYDIAFLLEHINKIRKIGKVLVVGDVYSSEEASFIERSVARKYGTYKYIVANSWKKYMDTSKKSITYDVTFFLSPRDLKDRNGLPVTIFQFQRLLDFAGLSASYNFLNGSRSAVSIGIDGDSLGQYAADLAYNFIKGKIPNHFSFTDRTLKINEKSMRNLNLRIPLSMMNLVPKENIPRTVRKRGE